MRLEAVKPVQFYVSVYRRAVQHKFQRLESRCKVEFRSEEL